MRHKQSGQAFILVLILLAIATVMVIPVLNLTDTALRSSQITTRRAKALYALDSAQEWVKWSLTWDSNFASSFTPDVPRDFTFNCCGTPVDLTIIMKAVPGRGGITLSTDDLMRPTKTVSASNPQPPVPSHPGYVIVANNSAQILTYVIRMEWLSSDTSDGLDAVYDIMPKDFGSGHYVAGSSYIRVDGGAWQSIPDPYPAVYSGQERLRWPASGNFTSPIRTFSVRQVKEIKFSISLTMPSQTKNTVQVNWVVLDMGGEDDVRTVSGPQAPIAIGTPADYDVYDTDGTPAIIKVAEPNFIPPGVEEDIQYTVTISNQSGDTLQIGTITDYMPPDFFIYYNNPAFPITWNGAVTVDPAGNPPPVVEVNGLNRQLCIWTFSPQKAIAAGTAATMIFWAHTTKDVSGSYYNELIVEADFTVPTIFSSIGVELEDYNVGYSWNAGGVVVPSYDSEAEADGVVLDANMALVTGGVAITSYQVR